jgi:hypothetical protein
MLTLAQSVVLARFRLTRRWTFTAPIDGYYTFDTCGSSYDTWLHIYGYNSDGTTGSLISTCDDCGPCGNRVVMSIGLNPGTCVGARLLPPSLTLSLAPLLCTHA